MITSVPTNIVLQKGPIKLLPLVEDFCSAFTELSKDSRIWMHHAAPLDEPELFRNLWFVKALQQKTRGKRMPFAIFLNHQLTGSSSYYDIDFEHKKLNVGYTWYHPSFWGTNLNALTKLTLLEYAFEVLCFNRVGFSVVSENKRSCKALEKLGIKSEGLLRNYLVYPNGLAKDAVIFSVIQEEWQALKKRIESKCEELCTVFGQ